MTIYLKNRLLLNSNHFYSYKIKYNGFSKLHSTSSSWLNRKVVVEGNIAHPRTRSCCEKSNSLRAAKMP